ncbi:MAG: 23S rRNA (pseudouridine(1915)-N(3))-methyltransferase RlmH [Neisseriaceae bacterium]|nr:23S rRNA (pseudouridine(1915)-N(3))-methyltransferase RlmH [Neisseriaceae bacterium]
MNINILAVGNKMPNWVETAVSDYAKRFGRDIKLSIKEIRPEKRHNTSATQCMAEEEKRIRAALPDKPYLVILDEHGANVTSLKLSQYIDFWKQNNIHPCFIIGGADGISGSLKKDADLTLRLSDLTLPHGLARVLLVEQLYRAVSILENHPYHRE